MKQAFAFFFVVFLSGIGLLFGELYHQSFGSLTGEESSVEWQVDQATPFDELIVSWNAKRPQQGQYALFVSVKLQDWSEELLYAVWGQGGQCTFTSTAQNHLVRTNEDMVQLLSGAKATGFRVRVAARNGATLDGLFSLHASLTDLDVLKDRRSDLLEWKSKESLLLPLAGRSSTTLDHPRYSELSLPAALSSATSYLCKKQIGINAFADNVLDAGFDRYAKGVLNAAHCYELLEANANVYLARLDSFWPIYVRLQAKIPTVIAVRGQFRDASSGRRGSHFLAVIGYDAQKDQILCMDPAGPNDAKTKVAFDREELLYRWSQRGSLAILIDRPMVEETNR